MVDAADFEDIPESLLASLLVGTSKAAASGAVKLLLLGSRESYVKILPWRGKARAVFVTFVGETDLSSAGWDFCSLACVLVRLLLTVTSLDRLSSHSCCTSLPERQSPSKRSNSLLVLGVRSSSSSRGSGSTPRPIATWLCRFFSPPSSCRTVVWEVLADGGAGRKVDLLSSSSEGSGLSSAVLKDSDRESVIVVLLEGIRWDKEGRDEGALCRPSVRGGVTSGVGGLR